MTKVPKGTRDEANTTAPRSIRPARDDQRLQERCAEQKKQGTMERTDDLHGQRKAREVLERHRNAEKKQIGASFGESDDAQATEGSRQHAPFAVFSCHVYLARSSSMSA